MKFGQLPCTIVQGLWSDFGANLKIKKNPSLIRISSNFLLHIKQCICIIKCMKMKNSIQAIFAKIWPITLYYSTGTLVRFLETLKIHKKSNFDRNQLKVSM